MRKFFSRSNLLLILASIIWGCAFVAQNVGMNYIGPWTFSTIRFLIAGFSLLAIIPILDKKRTHVIRPKTKEEKKKLLLGSVLCGLALSIGSIVQQIAMLTVPVAKAGFLTCIVCANHHTFIWQKDTFKSLGWHRNGFIWIVPFKHGR